MKPIRRTDSASQSCSCTSCLYKSESEQPSIRKYIAHGSRIDRLYFGKYIPLRERKLLNRLVRTRAVYDDLRARLISDSTLSLDKNADLRPRKHHHAIKPLDNTEKSGAILEIVDMIDKGAVGPKKLSECCSCCSCSSKVKILETEKKVHQLKRLITRGYERELAERQQIQRRERYHKGGVRFKAKHIRSEPCTCTYKFSGLIKKHSKAALRKLRHAPLEPFHTTEDLYGKEESKLRNFARKSRDNFKILQDKLELDIRKLNESRQNFKENIQLHTKKSLQEMRKVKNKLKTNIETGLKKSIEALKGLNKVEMPFEYFEYPENETEFRIKKDSITKFKDYLKRKQIMKDWECEMECEPDTCEPEECFRIIKIRRFQKKNRLKADQLKNEYEVFNRDIKVGDIPLKQVSSSIQAREIENTTGTYTKKQKPMLRIEGGNQVIGQRYIFETKEVKTDNVKRGTKNTMHVQKSKEEKAIEPISLFSAVSKRNVQGIKKHNQKNYKASKVSEYSGIKKESPGSRQAVRIASTFGFDVEFYKTTSDSKSSTKPSDIKPIAERKIKKVVRRHKGSQVILKPSVGTSGRHIKELNLKLEKLLRNAKTNANYGTKSTSSILKPVLLKQREHSSQTSLSESQKSSANDTSAASSPKQAVRIGSSFSFSVEFYKKNNDANYTETLEKVRQIHSRSKEFSPKIKKKKFQHYNNKRIAFPSKVKVKAQSVKDKYLLERAKLKSKFRKIKKTVLNTANKGTTVSFLGKMKTAEPFLVDKYVEARRENMLPLSKEYKLLPYECQPGICIPDECDPHVCLKLLELRNKRKFRKSKASYTNSLKAKSTSSVISRPFRPVKAKTVQSSVVPTKQYKTNAQKDKDNFEWVKNNLSATNNFASRRQAVRVSSSFSLSIEFHKGKEMPDIEPSISNLQSEAKYKKRKRQDRKAYQIDNKNKKHESVLIQVKNLDKNIGSSIRKCFCSLKLYKNKKNRNKMTANTQTFGDAMLMAETVNRGTKTKQKLNLDLFPYECEPYTCVPGECDPYICLEKIKRRQLNTKDFGMYTDKQNFRSVSSIIEYPYQRTTSVLAQPKLLQRGTHLKKMRMKPYRNYERIKERDIHKGGSGETVDDTNSKQAVRIGSSFNFSIEFSKQLPQTLTLTKIPTINKKIYNDKGVRITKVLVDHVDTQSYEPKKVNKALLVRPTLKRCFCTLNLLNKTTRQQYQKNYITNYYFTPRVVTISTAVATAKTELISKRKFKSDAELQIIGPKKKMISFSASSFLYNNYSSDVSKDTTFKLYPTHTVPVNCKQPIEISSNLSVEIKLLKTFSPYGSYILQRPIKSFRSSLMEDLAQGHSTFVTKTSREIQRRISSISQYLQQYFYTMNVQISHDRGYRRKHLKPYECEPGICIPGECDPYECQRMIMRRLKRNVSRGSSTDIINKSISSYASQSRSDSRSTQFKRHCKTRSQMKRQKVYNPQSYTHKSNKEKQAVRIGSSFSFDVEFFKNNSLPSERKYRQEEPSEYNYKRPAMRKKNLMRNRGAQGSILSGVDRQLQSAGSLVHRASYTPRMKRCFCTLKLQKRGKIHQKNVELNVQPLISPPETSSRNVKIGTKHHNMPIADIYNLKAYECEPGICVPGQCNPYECLEIMRHRRDFGVTATSLSQRSVSSLTNDRKKPISRAVYVKPKKAHQRNVKTYKDVQSIKSVTPRLNNEGSRQAVRIGSNFSFSVEFFKDAPPTSEIKESYKTLKDEPRSGDYVRPKRHKRNLMSQSSINVKHRDTQFESPTYQASTTTQSFMKRCFCTAKLLGKEIPDQTRATKFMQKCFCLLGFNKNTKDVQLHHNRVVTSDKVTNTDQRRIFRHAPLEPFECEPGVCIPGECDPYVCHKMIQRRMAKQYSKGSETDSVKTQSVSSTYGYLRPRHEGTQIRNLKHYKNKQHLIRKITPREKSQGKEDKRIVRIGSNFSFNVEFYKENGNNIDSKERSLKTDYYPKNVAHNANSRRKHLKTTGTDSVGPTMRSNQSQNERKETRAFGISPMLKRCFCTLKLLNSPDNQQTKLKAIKMDTKSVITKKTRFITPQTSLLEKQQLKFDSNDQTLSQFECEPYSCIPGECNPVECLERIKRRRQLMKDSGTVTVYPGRKSIGSVSTRSKKDAYLQAKFRNNRPNKYVQSYLKNSDLVKSSDKSRQAVRIGSNFSFNIEFFKDHQGAEANNSLDVPTQKKFEESYKKFQKRSTSSYFEPSKGTQVLPRKMRTTNTEMSHSKRCFCTLQLRNREQKKYDNVSLPTKSNHSAIGQFLKKCVCAFKISKLGKLQNEPPKPAIKYEIKGTSTSAPTGHIFNPIRVLEPYECQPYVCVPGECDPYECLKRIQRRQVRDFGTKYESNYKDTATDSMKGPETRCTEAQCFQKRRLHSQATSFPKKWKQSGREINHFSNPFQSSRQAVRIGSNFSFNIEFFKDHGGVQHADNNNEEILTKHASKFKTRSEKLSRPRASNMRRKLHCQSSQCPYLKRHYITTAANTLPKRCFCTLNLLNLGNKPQAPTVPPKKIEDKMTATNNKYIPYELGVYECPPRMCIPGECNPYECLDKMKSRGLMQKSRSVGTRARRTSIASEGTYASKFGDHKIQADFLKTRDASSYSKPQLDVSKSHVSKRNKSAVRIGSNFKFNVEFYKQKSQPAIIHSPKIVRARGISEDSKSYFSKPVAAKKERRQHHSLQVDNLHKREQGSDAGTMLKRCFCTLQLQRSAKQRRLQKNMHPGINVRYPQVITVGRVAVEPFNKNLLKSQKRGKVEKVKSTLTDPKFLNNYRNVGTKTNTKYLRNKTLTVSQCNPNNCPEYKNKHSLGRRNTYDEMETILPFAPKKFYKKESRTHVSHNKNSKKLEEHKELYNKEDHNLGLNTVLDKGKRLTAKKSRKSIPVATLNTTSKLNNSFFCRCANLFSKRTEKVNAPGKKESIEFGTPEVKLTVIPKRAKNLKFQNVNGAELNSAGDRKKHSKFHSEDAANNKVQLHSSKINASEKSKKSDKQIKMRVTFADRIKSSSNTNKAEEKLKKHFRRQSSTHSKLCYSCSVNDCPFRSGNLKKNENSQELKSGVFNLFSKDKKNNTKKSVTYSESADQCQYCKCCKRKIHADEISKGAGDRRLTTSSRHEKEFSGCPCEEGDEKITVLEKNHKGSLMKDKIHLNKVEPTTSKHLKKDSQSNKIKTSKSIKIKNKNGELGPCCKCKQPPTTTEKPIQGAKISMQAKGTSNMSSAFGNLIYKKVQPKTEDKPVFHPCVCGSKPCAKEAKKRVRAKKIVFKRGKPCVCGTPICSLERKKMAKTEEFVCKCQETLYERWLQKEKKKDLERRLKIEKEKDEIRRLKRLKEHKKLEKNLKKYQNASDIKLAIDTVGDIGKLGVATAYETLRTAAKAVYDPKLAYEQLKCKKSDPENLVKQIEKRYTESDAAATAKRIRMRLGYMKVFKSLRKRLEENVVTHFLLHVADTNPKTRKFKRKPVRHRREPLDFECSLYMASLRKRPYLYVYYKCPWFYPHFITMLNIWKQFTDVMLFLLAAVVWSPCILCMEGCRALMCCFFCTG